MNKVVFSKVDTILVYIFTSNDVKLKKRRNLDCDRGQVSSNTD